MSDLKPEIVNSVKLTLTYDTSRSKGSNDFSNLRDLKTWLDKNPVIAEQLGYTKKK